MEFSLEQLRELVTILNKTDITELTLESGDLRLSIRKSENRATDTTPVVSVAPSVNAISTAPTVSVINPTTIADSLSAKKLIEITSPMVGTFYRSPSPDDAPFIEIGDTVKKVALFALSKR